MLSTTVGQLLVNEALPDELRDYDRVLDKKGLSALLQQVAREHPEKYREVSFKLNQLGQRSAQDQGGMSFGARHLRRSTAANETRKRIEAQLARVLETEGLDDKQRADKIVRIVGKEMEPQQKAILEEAIKNNNPLALQVLSGSRGKPMNLASLLGGDMLYADHRDEVIPVPVLRSYSEGLSPEEYWAGTYGARRGIIATKFATQEAGFLSKQLNQAGHRLVVMDEESDDNPDRGLVVDTDDPDNEGALLARDIGPYKRNTPLTPKILKHLSRLGKSRILVRSPLIGGSPEGGVYARDVGIRETGKLPGRGEQVGLQAAQALSEPISQGQLSAKHSGGVAGQEKAVGGFQYINQLIQVPKKMQGGAAHSGVDGTVQRIEDAPAGGKYVTINDEKHYVGPGFDVSVKKGDEVEAGDLISDGIPNPSTIVQHKGVGEGRRYFVKEFKKAMSSSGMQGHRRNIELLARGLINHVKLTEETDDHAPDDIVPYSTFEHTYKPRLDHQTLAPKKAVGQYLERPILHYTIGTKVRPSMLKDFEEFGIKELAVHKQPPPFQPHMVRGMYQLQHDPDWMTQMYGSGLKKSLLDSTARGATSESRGTSFVPSLAVGTDFGQDPSRAVVKPQPSYELPKIKEVEEKTESPSSTFFGGKFKMSSDTSSNLPTDIMKSAFDSLLSQSGDKANRRSLKQMTRGSKPPRLPKPLSVPQIDIPASVPSSSAPPDANIMPQPAAPQPTAAPQPAAPQPAAPQPAAPQPPAASQPSSLIPGAELNPSIMPEAQGPGFGQQAYDFIAGDPNTVGNKNSLGNVNARWGMSTALNKTVGTAMPKATTWAQTGKNLLGSYAPGVMEGQNAARAAQAARAANVAKSGLGATGGTAAAATGGTLGTIGGTTVGGLAVAPALGGFVATNAATELADAAGILPEWAGGTGMGNMGWDQKGFENQTMQQGAVGNFGSAIMNPLKAVGEIGKGGYEAGKGVGNAIYNTATGTSNKDRHVANQSQQMRDSLYRKVTDYASQAENLSTAGEGQMDEATQARHNELMAKARDAVSLADAYNDETKDWKLGDQSWFAGGHKFRDAMAGTQSSLNDKIKALQAQGGPETQQTSVELDELRNQVDEISRLRKLYDDSDGILGLNEDFGHTVRNRVTGAKEQMVNIAARLREPEVQANPELVSQLERDLAYHQQRLQQYRGWAASANQ